jgi:hypothetical protein
MSVRGFIAERQLHVNKSSVHPGQWALGRSVVLADCGVMNESPPDLHMLNVVVADMSASLGFYRQLGVAGPDGAAVVGGHMQLRMPGGFSLELDTAESARLWHAGWRADPASVRVVIGFSLPTGRRSTSDTQR